MANDTASTSSPPPASAPIDKAAVAELIAKYGSSCATAWLEFDRYHLWQAPHDIPESSFRPVQGYMRSERYAFAWGNPLVSSPAALLPTAREFNAYVESLGLRTVWACVDSDLEAVLGGEEFRWRTVSCIYEDIIDASHVVELAEGEAEGPRAVKDLRKNIRRAERAHVQVDEIKRDAWTDEDRAAVEKGIADWKKSRSGLQLASTSLQPWLDIEHRRYWIARHEGKVVGVLILTPLASAWQIKNAVPFPGSPKGTSEALIYGAARTLNAEGGGHVTFGISAAKSLEPHANLSGWRINALAKTYGSVASSTGLVRRGEFRGKFDSSHEPMYVCFPEEDFGLGGVNALLKALKQN